MKKIVYFSTILVLILVIIVLMITIIFPSLVQEAKKEYIDRYNFKQLNKVKEILDKRDGSSYTFENIKQFNDLFQADLQPIQNCYFISDRKRYFKDNNESGYIFGFKLESKKYKEDYGVDYYAYPKYDLPTDIDCFGFGSKNGNCKDGIKNYFESYISKPCPE